jgi:integrase
VPVLHLTQKVIDQDLHCPDGKKRIEYCDRDTPGLYLECRNGNSSPPTYYLRSKDAGGKTNHTKLGRAPEMSLADARREAKTRKAQLTVSSGQRAPEQAIEPLPLPTLNTFFHQSYLPHAKASKRSWKKDEGLFRLRIDAVFGARRLDQLQRHELQTFHNQLLGQGIAPATADHHLKLIRQVLNKAVEWDVLERNPIAKVKLFNPDNRMENYMDEAELGRLLSVLRTDSNRGVANVALFLVSTGARLNEALTAKWEHIDETTRVWRIPASNSKSKKIRSIPLNDAALELLASLGTRDLGGHVFVSDTTGQPLKWIHKVWERIREQAGLPKLRLHDLRHQFASLLINAGRSLYEVQKLLGHSSHSVTERYAHLSSASLMEAANTASVKLKVASQAA